MNLQLFFDRLKAERVKRGSTQDDMAAALGVSKRSYCAYEAGETAPSAKLLAALASMNIDIAYLLTGIDAKAQGRLATLERSLEQASQHVDSFEDIKRLGTAMNAQMKAQAPAAQQNPRLQKLIDNYENTDESGKKIIEATASAAAQSDKRKKA